LEPEEVFRLMRNGECLLVDVRGEDCSAGLIEGAVHEPAIGDPMFHTRVAEFATRWAAHQLVVFTCQYSAHRAPTCANWYKPVAGIGQRVAILEGGFRGWEAKSLPTVALAKVEAESRKADAYALEAGMEFAAAASKPEARMTQPAASSQHAQSPEADAPTAPGISPVKLAKWMQALSP